MDAIRWLLITSGGLGMSPVAPGTVGTFGGVGLARGVGAIDLRVIGGIIVSWVVTLPIGGVLAAFFFFTLKGMFG